MKEKTFGKGVLVMNQLIEENRGNILKLTEEHQYVLLKFDILGPLVDQIGSLILKNIVTNEVEEYTIWIGDDDLSWFYVCLPTNTDYEDGDEIDDDLDVYSLEDLNIIPYHLYSNLSWE